MLKTFFALHSRGNFLAFIISVVLGGCAPSLERLKHDMDHHIVRDPSFWTFTAKRPFAQRVFASPPQLLDYLTKDNLLNGYEARPRPASSTTELRRDIESTLQELPAAVKALVDARLKGIFLVEDLGTSAYTEYTRNAQGEPEAAFVVLDVKAINRRANAWFSWKESTPFLEDKVLTIEGTLERPDADTRANTLQYLLLHEFGHVIAANTKIHPHWGSDPNQVHNSVDYPFFNLSWTIVENSYKRKSDFSRPMPGKVAYYAAPRQRVASRQMIAYYDWLEKSDFPSLYAATNPFDDFAESFASFVHVVLMNKPYTLAIKDGHRLLKTYESCWQQARCQAKRQFLVNMLAVTP